MKKTSCVFLFLLAVAFFSIECHKGNGNPISIDDCEGDLEHLPAFGGDIHSILRADSTWEIQSPAAAGDCTALYSFTFRWANPAKQHDTIPPPLKITFSPAGSQGSEIPQKEGSYGSYPGTGWWHIGFALTPTSTIGNTTKYTITVKNTTNDSTELLGSMSYRISPN